MQPLPQLPDEIEAPVQKGQELGYLKVMLAGEQIGTVPPVAAEDVEADPALVYLEKDSLFHGLSPLSISEILHNV